MIDHGLAARFCLNARRSAKTHGFIGAEGDGGIVRVRQDGIAEGRGILDGLSGALGQEGKHRMGSVAEKRHPPLGPVPKRRAIDQRPFTPGLRGGEKLPDRVCPRREALLDLDGVTRGRPEGVRSIARP